MGSRWTNLCVCSLLVWWCFIQDRQGNHIIIESRYEETCTFYEKLMRRVPYLTVTKCQWKNNSKYDQGVG